MNTAFVRLAAITAVIAAMARLAPAQVAPRPSPNADVPVRTVMLFSSGVGYFEHGGTVSGAATTELRFRTVQINDILKSLVLRDLDGGRVSRVTYPANDPVARTLKTFQIDITENPSFAQLLNQLRGAEVSVQAQGERLAGTILGVETVRRVREGNQSVDAPVLNLLLGATIRALGLETITSLTLNDAQLQDELTRALAALSEARNQDKKPVTISFTGAGSRRVRVGYVVETPVWKTSYRLLLDSSSARVHGWAIVENQTEADWNSVSLSLVSGRPISFMMDLYSPLYARRPVVVPELFAALRPQAYSGAIGGVTINAPPVPLVEQGVVGSVSTIRSEMMAARRADGVGAGSGRASAATAPPSPAMLAVQGSAERIGALFHYDIADVSIPRQRSAMLPIIDDSIRVERVSIYNASVLGSNPLTGVRLHNTTGQHLLQGPVTVLERGRYAGDARIEDVPPGQDRLLSFGVDLETLVQRRDSTRPAAVLTGRIDKGVLTLDRRYVTTVEYIISNKGDRDKVVLVEHPIHRNWTLVDTPRPVETTQTTYRFQGSARPGAATTLTVTEQTVASQTVTLLEADTDALLTWSRTGAFPRDVRDALARAATLRQALTSAERDIAEGNRLIAEIEAEQGRIRENMKTVAAGTQYYDRLLAKLNEQESRIEQLQRERLAATGRRDARRVEFEEFIAEIATG